MSIVYAQSDIDGVKCAHFYLQGFLSDGVVGVDGQGNAAGGSSCEEEEEGGECNTLLTQLLCTLSRTYFGEQHCNYRKQFTTCDVTSLGLFQLLSVII